MKILHTADWHIGRKLFDKDLYEEQKDILEKIIEQIKIEKPDAVIIAGDLYDKSVPSKEATELLTTTLKKINIDYNLPVLAISGNHDSRERLAVGDAWFSKYQFYLHTRLEQSFNKISIADVDFYLLPYINPYEVKSYFNDDSINSHHNATKKIVDTIYETMDETRINILVAHTFVAGGVESSSEREISIGTIENVAVDVFAKFDYVALGHLHKPNALKNDKIKYSGSPLCYSFDEAGEQKGIRIVEITKTSLKEKFVPLTPLRKLHNIKADFKQIMDKDFRKNYDENDFYNMELTGLSEVTDPMPKIQKYYPNTLALKSIVAKKDSKKIEKEHLLQSPENLIIDFCKSFGEDVTKEGKSIIKKIIREIEDETY